MSDAQQKVWDDVASRVPNIPGRDELVRLFVREHDFESVLDIGCGQGPLFHILASKGARITGLDILPEYMVPSEVAGMSVEYVQADFMSCTPESLFGERRFDAVLASHLVEHMPDTERFLRHFLSFLQPGGTYCLIWPPPKPYVVGGHVHVFNMGMMLYNLVRIGIDCRGVTMLRSGYSLGIIGTLRTFEVPPLAHDAGDIERLSVYFPVPVSQGFDGDNVPGIRNIPYR